MPGVLYAIVAMMCSSRTNKLVGPRGEAHQ
jgi:hypothetical protein